MKSGWLYTLFCSIRISKRKRQLGRLALKLMEIQMKQKEKL